MTAGPRIFVVLVVLAILGVSLGFAAVDWLHAKFCPCRRGVDL